MPATLKGERLRIRWRTRFDMEVCRFVGNEDIEGGEELIDSLIDLAS
jgi:hypothetical protein